MASGVGSDGAPGGPGELSEEEGKVAAAKEVIETGSKVSREVFVQAMQKLLNLAISGYPRAMRSTRAKRNELLRAQGGGEEKHQDAAVELVRSSAAKLSEETKTWVLGLVPYVGLPSKVLYPTWCALRRVCLLAGVYGHDLEAEATKVRMLHAFCGMRSVPIAELVLETAVQAVWEAVAGPAAAFVPVGVLTSKVANVEGHVMAVVGKEQFGEGRRDVPESEYEQVLDGEPSVEDYLGLAKDSVAYAILRSWAVGRDSALMALDARQRDEALAEVLRKGKLAAAGGTTVAGMVATLATGAVAAAPGMAAKGVALAGEAMAAAPGIAAKGMGKGMAIGNSLIGGLTGGKKAT